MSSLHPPSEVVEIAARLRRAGHEAWCVGGAVRDALLGHAHLDWDLATSARPQDVQQVFKRTVPVGLEFGTVGVLDTHNVMHEVTTFRKDVNTDGRHAVVEFGVSLDDDLARRDFTINAIAYDPESGELRDPFDGRTDLKRGVLRAVGTPEERMREDRLRALRGIRFAARFRFHIEPLTWAAIKASAPHLGRLSAERVKQELEKTMQQVEHPSIALEWWRECGALAVLVPSIAAAPAERFLALDLLPLGGKGDGDGNGGGLDHRGGTGEGEGGGGRRGDPKGATLNRLAMLFFGDEPASVERATKALKFSNADSAWIVHLARARREVGEAIDASSTATVPEAAQIRRWVAKVGRTRVDAFLRLNSALHLARTAMTATPTATNHARFAVDESLRARLEALRARAVEIAFRDPIELADLAIDGEDLRALGVGAGPEMGRVLRTLLEQVVDDPSLNTVAQLQSAVKDLIATSPGN